MATPPDTEKYEVLEKIGHGSFGIIRKVKRKSDGYILCRKEINYIKMSHKEREQLQSEFSILHSLRHPNIVAYFHREHLKSSQDLHLYMEYCDGGDLSRVIEKLRANNQFAEEPYVWSIFSQLITALYRCHYGVDPPEVGKNVMAAGNPVKQLGLRLKSQVMILHRDLKPENVFLGADNSVKLGDFGLSKIMQSHDFASTYVGTPFYMSPEICAAERYTLHSDIWSLGCIMYELCARAPPFNAKTHFQLIQKIKGGRVDPLPSVYSPELENIIKSCLKVNPLHRPDTHQLLNLPMIRLMRKEREVVELGKVLKTAEELAKLRALEVEAKASNLDHDKENMRAAMEATVRREWEVKARLEIDRQIQLAMEDLNTKFETAVQIRVEKEVQQQLKTIDLPGLPKNDPPSSPTDIQLSSIATSTSTDFPSSTDLSSLSPDSPTLEKSSFNASKRTSRTPFSRARTQFDSPMDIQMGEPSPMSIASLALSPRRTGTAAASSLPSCKNIFATAAAQKDKISKLNSMQLPPSPPTHLEPTLEDEEDYLPDLHSPTRLPSSRPATFKSNTRPGLLRQKTAPTRRLNANPSLFTTAPMPKPLGRNPSPTNTSTATGSPVRKAPGKTTQLGDNDMFKAVMQKNLYCTGGGRTLVELAQARAGGVPVVAVTGKLSENDLQEARGRDVPIWDPEKDEMPSPFLVRGGRGLRRL